MINTYLKDFYSRYVPLKCETHLPPKVKVLQRNAVVRDVASWISWWNHLFVFMRFRLKNEAFLSIVVEHRTLPETKSSHLKIGHPKRKLIFQPSIFRCYISFREGNNQFPSVLKLNLWFACTFFFGVLFYIPPFVLHLPNKTPLDMSLHAPGEPQPADGKVDLPWVLGRALKALRNDSWRLLLEPWSDLGQNSNAKLKNLVIDSDMWSGTLLMYHFRHGQMNHHCND